MDPFFGVFNKGEKAGVVSHDKRGNKGEFELLNSKFALLSKL